MVGWPKQGLKRARVGPFPALCSSPGTPGAGAADTDTRCLGNTAESVTGLNVLTQQSAEVAIDTVDEALNQVSAARSSAGAALNRIARSIILAQGQSYELSRARQRIRDADIAVEISELTRAQTRQGALPLLAQVARLEIERSLFLITSLNR